MTTIEKEWAERVCAAAATKTPLCLRGGGTKDFYGRAAVGEVFDVYVEHLDVSVVVQVLP